MPLRHCLQLLLPGAPLCQAKQTTGSSSGGTPKRPHLVFSHSSLHSTLPSPVWGSQELPAAQHTDAPAGPHTCAAGQHAPLTHALPAGQQAEPHTWLSVQQLLPRQTWPAGQHFCPHCRATLQQAPKKQVSTAPQHCCPHTLPALQQLPLSRHSWPSRQAHSAPLGDCSSTRRTPFGETLWSAAGLPPMPGAGAGASGALGLGGGGTLSSMHWSPMQRRGGRQLGEWGEASRRWG